MNYRELFDELKDVAAPLPIEVEIDPSIVKLRPYQAEAVDATFASWGEGNRSVLVQLPTGCGKSVLFAEIMRRVANG